MAAESQPNQPSGARRAGWSLVGVIGYLLSPLSWWNDLWVNIPLAYAAANLVCFVWPSAFLPSLAVAYWATNILGLILLHAGASGAVRGTAVRMSRRAVLWWAAWSLLYTLVIVGLCAWGILRPLPDYVPVR